jgi:hypothetical protein
MSVTQESPAITATKSQTVHVNVNNFVDDKSVGRGTQHQPGARATTSKTFPEPFFPRKKIPQRSDFQTLSTSSYLNNNRA